MTPVRTRATTTHHARLTLGALLTAGAVLVTGCGSDAGSTTDNAAGGATTDAGLHDRLPGSIKNSGVLRIGTVTSTTPLTEKPGKEVTGLIPDLAHAMGAKLGVEVEFVESPMADQVAALQSDRVDVAWSAMTPTAEREQAVNMVPYIRTVSAPIVQKGNPAGIKEAKDLCGQAVGIVRGGNSHVALQSFQKRVCEGEGLQPIDAKLYDKSADGLLQLQSGKIQAFVGIGIQLRHVAETANGGSTFDFVDTAVDRSVMTICTAKPDAQLAELVRDTLAQVVDSGEYATILKEYGGEGDALKKDEVVLNPSVKS